MFIDGLVYIYDIWTYENASWDSFLFTAFPQLAELYAPEEIAEIQRSRPQSLRLCRTVGQCKELF